LPQRLQAGVRRNTAQAVHGLLVYADFVQQTPAGPHNRLLAALALRNLGISACAVKQAGQGMQRAALQGDQPAVAGRQASVSRQTNSRLPALHEAAALGNIAALRQELAAEGSVAAVDELGNTPLHFAALYGATKAVGVLIAAGADVNAANALGRTPLHYAALQQQQLQQSPVLHQLLAGGAAVDAADAGGWTPLHFAAIQAVCHGRTKALSALISAGAAINAADNSGNTPLHFAAQGQHHLTGLQVLLAAGASVAATDAGGNTPLHLAVWCSQAAVGVLLSAGADPNAVNIRGMGVLAAAAAAGRLHISQLLLDAGADLHAADAQGRTAVGWALSSNSVQRWLLMERLLAKGADGSGVVDDQGVSLLVVAAAACEYYVVELLLQADVDGIAQTTVGREALSVAATAGYCLIVELLLDAGADPNAVNNMGIRVLAAAAAAGQLQTSQLLLEAGADLHAADAEGRTAVGWAMSSNSVQGGFVVEHLLSKGAAPSAADCSRVVDKKGVPLLVAAAAAGKHSVVELLLQADVDGIARTAAGRQALAVAATSGYGSTVALLLNAGADPNAVNNMGMRVLAAAAAAGQLQTSQLLLEAGADLHAADAEGRTALGWAMSARPPRVNGDHPVPDWLLVEYLLSKGGDGSRVVDKQGLPLLVAAAAAGKHSVVELLLQADVDGIGTIAVGRQALAVAATSGCGSIVKLLLNAGADPNANVRGRGDNILAAAAGSGYTEVVELLLSAGADPGVVTASGKTALDAAVGAGHSVVVQQLLSAGADPNSSLPGRSVSLLRVAATAGYRDVVGLLPQAGAAFDARALDLAVDNGHADVVDLLLRQHAPTEEQLDRLIDRAHVEAILSLARFPILLRLLQYKLSSSSGNNTWQRAASQARWFMDAALQHHPYDSNVAMASISLQLLLQPPNMVAVDAAHAALTARERELASITVAAQQLILSLGAAGCRCGDECV